MAVLHNKEEKIQAVLGRLPKKYTDEQFLAMFIKLYSKDWGKIKSAYIKQSQDREPGAVINMPKPDIYLKQVTTAFLQRTTLQETVTAKEEVLVEEVPLKIVKKAKTTAKKAPILEESIDKPIKSKTAAKKKAEIAEETAIVKKPRAVAKKKIVAETTDEGAAIVKPKKAKAVKE